MNRQELLRQLRESSKKGEEQNNFLLSELKRLKADNNMKEYNKIKDKINTTRKQAMYVTGIKMDLII